MGVKLKEVISLEDLRTIHKDTLVRYKGCLVYIVDFVSAKRVEILHLDTRKHSIVQFNTQYFDFSPIRIGYVNYRGVALYITRSPIRQYKQGISPYNIKVSLPNNIRLNTDYKKSMVQSAFDEIKCLKDVALLLHIDGNYPSIEDAISSVIGSEDVVLKAFDKQFAIDSLLNLYYKTDKVGAVVTTNPVSFKFDKDKEYLRELL
jgi:hypothetical protein